MKPCNRQASIRSTCWQRRKGFQSSPCQRHGEGDRLRSRGWRGLCNFLQLPHNCISNGCRIGQHIPRWKPDNFEALPRQPGIPGTVASWLIAHIVRQPIDFHSGLELWRVEVDHIGANGVLATKFDACTIAAQNLPKEYFRQGHFVAKSASGHDGFNRLRQLTPPPFAAQTVPLPIAARRGGYSFCIICIANAQGDRACNA